MLTKQEADGVLDQFELLSPVAVTDDEDEGAPALTFRFNNPGASGVSVTTILADASQAQLEELTARLPLQETDRAACLAAFVAANGS